MQNYKTPTAQDVQQFVSSLIRNAHQTAPCRLLINCPCALAANCPHVQSSDPELLIARVRLALLRREPVAALPPH